MIKFELNITLLFCISFITKFKVQKYTATRCKNSLALYKGVTPKYTKNLLELRFAATRTRFDTF